MKIAKETMVSLDFDPKNSRDEISIMLAKSSISNIVL